MATITFVNLDDWQGVYIDDELYDQTHSVFSNPVTFLGFMTELGFDVSYFTDEDECVINALHNFGQLPDSLSDLVDA